MLDDEAYVLTSVLKATLLAFARTRKAMIWCCS